MEETLLYQTLTKTQIKKLGKSIRHELQYELEISEASLYELQMYRTSFQKDIAEVFNILSDSSKRIRKDRVVTFRIKRIESIISKIRRQPTMQLDTMGDIAGCRCIVQSDAAVVKIVEALEKKLIVKRRKDYLNIMKADGYRAYHLYVQSPINPDKQIEIQLRSQESHNWATLVEIIDVSYELKIKEGEQHPDLKDFLLLMSRKDHLVYSEKDRIIEVENKYKIYLKLSSLFSKNYLIIRKAWLKLESKTNHTYFIISVDKNKTPRINSYNNYEEAEEVYFDTFSQNKDSNVVLTHLDEVDFRKLCIAYSNYLLIKHSFLNEWQRIMLDQIKIDYSKRRRNKANQVVEYFKDTINAEEKHINTEVEAIRRIMDDRNEEYYLSKDTKLNEWLLELEEMIKEGKNTKKELDRLLSKYGKSTFSQIFN